MVEREEVRRGRMGGEWSGDGRGGERGKRGEKMKRWWWGRV